MCALPRPPASVVNVTEGSPQLVASPDAVGRLDEFCDVGEIGTPELHDDVGADRPVRVPRDVHVANVLPRGIHPGLTTGAAMRREIDTVRPRWSGASQCGPRPRTACLRVAASRGPGCNRPRLHAQTQRSMESRALLDHAHAVSRKAATRASAAAPALRAIRSGLRPMRARSSQRTGLIPSPLGPSPPPLCRRASARPLAQTTPFAACAPRCRSQAPTNLCGRAQRRPSGRCWQHRTVVPRA